MDEQKKYNKEYYRARAEEISHMRRKKYKSDPEIRGKAVERARKYREKMKQDNKGVDLRGRRKGPLPPRSIELPSGQEVMSYSSGYIAEALGISRSTLRKWIDVGKIPVTPYRLPSGRWWTQRMLDAFVRARDELEGGVRNIEFPALVDVYWPKDEMEV